jgi:anaerobic selenocysteine-containing dehydrogenase
MDVSATASPAPPCHGLFPPAQHHLQHDLRGRLDGGREGRPTALIHPEDAGKLGVEDGGRVRLGNGRGEVIVHARLFDGLQQGVIVVESVWPNADFEGGIGINALTSDDPAPPAGGAVFHDTAVWMRAIAAQMEVEVPALAAE